jgi:Sulfotransferase family
MQSTSARPNYLEDPGAPEMISRMVPDARIIVSLRDPVERFHSTYLMIRNNLPSMGTVMQEIRRGLEGQDNPRLAVVAPRTGLYADQVRRYRAVFGESRFKILVFEEMMADVPGTLRDILAFLGIEHPVDTFAEPPQRQYGEARGPVVRFLFGNRLISRASESLIPYKLRKKIRSAFLVKEAPKPALEPEARDFLVRYYRDDVARLEEILGRRLPWRHFGSDAMSRSAG